jgi:hypothetical protein
MKFISVKIENQIFQFLIDLMGCERLFKEIGKITGSFGSHNFE